jgi:hypothetical protein
MLKVVAPGNSQRHGRWCRRKSSLALALGLSAIAITAVIGLSISGPVAVRAKPSCKDAPLHSPPSRPQSAEASQTLAVPSLLAAASRLPSGLKAT